ncbi:hypothetical protein EVAR_10547_1 [Eumeta japonica]|uniref:Uncharacterized protein n=1 Tax=Eumeta variegata TaxID=151549 RepID=A0A4C1ZHV3_EUMVA|nr:hypothetical protein EVAR_10547_1 [Eumeta japonica]
MAIRLRRVLCGGDTLNLMFMTLFPGPGGYSIMQKARVKAAEIINGTLHRRRALGELPAEDHELGPATRGGIGETILLDRNKKGAARKLTVIHCERLFKIRRYCRRTDAVVKNGARSRNNFSHFRAFAGGHRRRCILADQITAIQGVGYSNGNSVASSMVFSAISKMPNAPKEVLTLKNIEIPETRGDYTGRCRCVTNAVSAGSNRLLGTGQRYLRIPCI